MTNNYYSNNRPTFEEIDSDEDTGDYHHHHHSHQQPTVETPDDPSYHSNHHRPHNRRTNRSSRNSGSNRQRGSMLSTFFNDPFDDDFFSSGMPSMFGRMDNMMDSMMGNIGSFPSNMGQGGNNVYYSSSTTTTSHNGVTHSTHQVKDSKTGTEKTTVRRKIGDKSHTIEQMRNQNGEELTTKKLENIKDDEEHEFENMWNQTTQNSHFLNQNSNRLMNPSSRNNRGNMRSLTNGTSRRK